MRHGDGMDSEDLGSNPGTEPTIGDLIGRRLGRRDALRGLLGAGAAASVGYVPGGGSAMAQPIGPSSPTFEEVPHGLDKTHHVPTGYEAQKTAGLPSEAVKREFLARAVVKMSRRGRDRSGCSGYPAAVRREAAA